MALETDPDQDAGSSPIPISDAPLPEQLIEHRGNHDDFTFEENSLKIMGAHLAVAGVRQRFGEIRTSRHGIILKYAGNDSKKR